MGGTQCFSVSGGACGRQAISRSQKMPEKSLRGMEGTSFRKFPKKEWFFTNARIYEESKELL